MIKIACGDSFSLALTQSGKLYSWGHFEDGRLGITKIKGPTLISENNKYTYQPQLINFTQDHIDSIGAAGALAYCSVSGTSDLKSLDLSDVFSTRTYLWGKVTKGLAMDTHDHAFNVPSVFKQIQSYQFSNQFIQHDFAIGIGHSVQL